MSDRPDKTDLYAALNILPQPFQCAALQAYESGASGLVSVPTGSGKTLAVLAGPLQRMALSPVPPRRKHRLQVLLITPLKALTRDTANAIKDSLNALNVKAEVGLRTGDVSQYHKQKQAAAMPDILVTTPESLSLLLARSDASSRFTFLHSIIIDEWHALLANKRGTMTELCLARLRTWCPDVQTWALSATIGDPVTAAYHAVGYHSSTIDNADTTEKNVRTNNSENVPAIITTTEQKTALPADMFSSEFDKNKGPHNAHKPSTNYLQNVDLNLVLPPSDRTLPWAGHLGLRMAGALLRALSPDVPTIIFTNTRRQAEKWYQHLCEARPHLAERIALHHGSLNQAEREANEAAAKSGRVVWTIATASLDLGIDYPGIELVVQIGSPKSIGRLLQRAGRAGHRPGALSRLLFVPTHALELVEFQALRSALSDGHLENIEPLLAPRDVLAQHLVTLACGEGFETESIYDEIRSTKSYAHLCEDDFKQTLQFIQQGGACLTRYDHYKKACPDDTHRWRITSKRMAAEHRMQIGTITSDPQVTVTFKNRRTLGTVEETFITRLRPGDTFYFAGQHLRFDSFRAQTAFVSKAANGSGVTPAWSGGTLPISPALAEHVRSVIATPVPKNRSKYHQTQKTLPKTLRLKACPKRCFVPKAPPLDSHNQMSY